jgi:16S rRNA (cytosine967-C5)-methyltransferase
MDPVTLAEQLSATARVVHSVTTAGRSLTETLAQVDPALRAGVQALAFHALRHWGEAQVLIGLLAEHPPKPPVGALLGVALTLQRPVAADQQTHKPPTYPPHTLVDQAVAAVSLWRETAGATGFVNACLRRYLREQAALWAQAQTDALARWNHPFWWIKRLRRDHPAHWQAILQAAQWAAPMTLRVNRQRCSRSDYLQTLRAAGLAAREQGTDGLVLAHPVPVEQLPGWAQGWVSVQDGAAQLAAPLLWQAGLQPGDRVLDACAAPGGKTAHLLEWGDVEVQALEVDARRVPRLQATLQRLGLRAQVRQADAGQPDRWWDGRLFDAVLLDAPCTASGIVRRHPDVRWLRRPTDIEHLAAEQSRLLEALWPLVRPGGHLLYCTCSVFLAEGSGQIDRFLARHANAQVLPAPGHLLPGAAGIDPIGDNGHSGLDGFFYALLRKLPTA